MRVSGPAGLLRVGYQHAATLGAWEMVQSPAPGGPSAFVFQSTLRQPNAYWMTQTPLDLVVSVGSAEWLWRDVKVTYLNSTEFTITLTEVPIVSERRPAVGE